MGSQDSSHELNVGSKRPGGVGLAGLFLAINSGAGVMGLLLEWSGSVVSLFLIAFFAFAFVVSFAVIALKTWAYWAFLGITTLLFLNNVSELMLFGAGMHSKNDFQVSHVTSVLWTLGFALYFCSHSVKQAFNVHWTFKD